MTNETPYTRTLHRAVSICGGVSALAHRLAVSADDLTNWLDGHFPPPLNVYFAALDLVAKAHIPQRRIRRA
jgi:hypothetical protein